MKLLVPHMICLIAIIQISPSRAMHSFVGERIAAKKALDLLLAANSGAHAEAQDSFLTNHEIARDYKPIETRRQKTYQKRNAFNTQLWLIREAIRRDQIK